MLEEAEEEQELVKLLMKQKPIVTISLKLINPIFENIIYSKQIEEEFTNKEDLQD